MLVSVRGPQLVKCHGEIRASHRRNSIPIAAADLDRMRRPNHQQQASAGLRLDTSRTLHALYVASKRRVRLNDETDETPRLVQYAIHPVTGRYTRYGALPMRGARDQRKRCGCHGSVQLTPSKLIFSDAHYYLIPHQLLLPPSPRTPAAMSLTITPLVPATLASQPNRHITDKILVSLPTIDSSAELLTSFPAADTATGAKSSALAYAILRPW